VNSRRVLNDTGYGLLATDPGPVVVRSVLSEEAFQRMIALERKRTERSHKPFLLMLLDMGGEISANNGGGGLGRILSVLALATRETDVVGWYKDGAVVGAMFTEIDLEEKKHILNTVQTRVRRALDDNLSLEQVNQISISFHWFPEEWQKVISRRPNAPVLYPDLAKRDQARKLFCALKRAMDICGSLVALVVASPIFLLIALAVKLTSKGPIFFKQNRVGHYGNSFPLLKFRSMKANNNCSLHKEYVLQLIAGVAEKKPCKGNGQGLYKLTSDPRITSVGAFLRRTSLDELPQFINVLKGEMSLVGPRPPIGYEVDKYDLWHRRRVMEAKPGITGLWQVNGRNRLGFNEMVRLDLMYARSWSPWLDLKILLRTPRAVVAGAR
jgi:lipopolysaccharide/colanic/teichoic acid biosynthesis glycosyltransferase